MGKYLTPEKIQEEMLKDVKAILARVLKRVKATGGQIGETEASVFDGQAFLMFESNLGRLDLMIRDEIGNARLELVSVTETEGIYDWDADAYIRPAGVAWFKRA